MKNILVALAISLMFTVNSVANDTGAWFDPEQDGHGITLVETPNGDVFWWYAYDAELGQVWFISSVEQGEDFVVYRPRARTFPTAEDFEVGEAVGTVRLDRRVNGTIRMTWDLLEAKTCTEIYGPTPPGPLDPRCRDENGGFDSDALIVTGVDSEGQADLIRLTPEQP